MRIEKTALEGVVIIEPDVFTDERGVFMETFQEKRYQEMLGISERFVQDNLSLSKKNVLRGLHYQAPPFAQGKLVQVLRGKVLDVAVDVRFGSPTFGKHVAIALSGENHRQVYIPSGFAHGFLAQTDGVVFSYKCTSYYSKDAERRGVLWNDPSLGIDWGIADPILNERDRQALLFRDIEKDFIYQENC